MFDSCTSNNEPILTNNDIEFGTGCIVVIFITINDKYSTLAVDRWRERLSLVIEWIGCLCPQIR